MERQVHPWVAEGQTRPRFAIVSVFLSEWKDILRFAQRAERLGFDAYWANDHPNRSMDTWTLLTGLAMGTERIRLISLVSCIYYRSPVLIARQAADVDRVSEGRLVLGIGIGDDIPEFNQMCLPFPPIAQRQETMEEALLDNPGVMARGNVQLRRQVLSPRQADLRPNRSRTLLSPFL